MFARLFSLTVAVSAALPLHAQDWKPIEAPIMTRWAKEVSPDNVLPEYPRPQMVREKWQNLNGLWDYAIQSKDEQKASEWDGKILVPFAAESALSGVMKNVGDENKLWYRRMFTVPQDWRDARLGFGSRTKQRLLLHFGAVDWQAAVWVNGKEVGQHEGGYDPFSFDITDALKEGEEQELVVAVWDPTDKGPQPRGKQLSNPHGIWYTPVTGIWQTVWIEPVAKAHITSLNFTPRIERNRTWLDAEVSFLAGSGKGVVDIEVSDGKESRTVRSEMMTNDIGERDPATEHIAKIEIPMANATLWSPDSPFLYDVKVQLRWNGLIDEVESYAGMRKIEVAKDSEGVNRLFLNGKPVFQFGPLDQGWWPDGLYTAPTDEALKYDIEITKQLGFNMARKHVKTEPARWYYHCDKMGLLVWQDMPNGDAHIRPDAPDINRTPESEAIYRKEWTAIVESLKNHPCIVCWVPFNEGWGQFKTNEYLAFTKQLDPTRLVDGPSGWTDRGEGDMHDMHMYPGPGMFRVESARASVLGEFGGLGWPVEGHLWKSQNNWGYRTYRSQEELIRNYKNLIVQLPPLISRGLAAAVYTQTTDVEVEVNGLMTYDRAVIKLPPDQIAPVNRIVYQPAPRDVVIAPTSEEDAQKWRYTFEKPAEGWTEPNFDDSGWKEGAGGFGTEGTPGAVIGTTWNTPQIWMRRTVKLPEKLDQLGLRIHHDEEATIHLNGEKIGEVSGYITEYALVPLTDEATKAAKPGENVLAVTCKQTGGGQYIDVGLLNFVPAKEQADQAQSNE